MSSYLRQEQNQEALMHCSGESSDSAVCIEERLFRSWQTKLNDLQEEDLMKLDDHSKPTQVSAQNAPHETAETEEEDMDDELVEADPTAWGQDLVNLQENMEAKHAADHAKTEWGKDLASLQGSMEAKHAADHAKRTQEATFWA